MRMRNQQEKVSKKNTACKRVTFAPYLLIQNTLKPNAQLNHHTRRGKRKNTTKTIDNLKLLTINTRGIKSKCMSLTTALHQHGTHIAAITETQLTSNENINIQGYKWIGKNRETGKGGGVGFLIRNDIDNIVSEIKGTIMETNKETLCIKVKGKITINIAVMYGLQENAKKKKM